MQTKESSDSPPGHCKVLPHPRATAASGGWKPGHRLPPSVLLPFPRASPCAWPGGTGAEQSTELPRWHAHLRRARRGPRESMLPGSAEAAPGAALPEAATGRSPSARRAGTGGQPRAPGAQRVWSGGGGGGNSAGWTGGVRGHGLSGAEAGRPRARAGEYLRWRAAWRDAWPSLRARRWRAGAASS